MILAGEGVLGPGRALSSARATGFALHGESLFLVWPRKSNPKEGHPRRQAPAAPGFPPSVVIPGARHEGPSMALGLFGFGVLRRSTSCIHAVVAASMPLDPFHADSARPDEGGMGAVPTSAKSQTKSQEPGAFFGIDPESPGNTPIPCRSEFIHDRRRYEASGAARAAADGRPDKSAPTPSRMRLQESLPPRTKSEAKGRKAFSGSIPSLQASSPVPFRRPSAGVAEGDARQDAERVTKGQGRPFVTCPRSGAGAREPRRSRGRMTGRAFSLRGQRESDSPYKAKPVVSAEESIRLGTKPSRQLPKNPSLQAGKTYRSGTGGREPRRSRGRMTGRVFSLVTFSLRGQRESDSPYKAKPAGRAEESIQPGTKPSRQPPETSPLPGRENASARHQGQEPTRSMHRP
ncbi:hypothetical protein AvCA_52040 [Azotobacter vinelandii CA]|uniref:Uncharacterized protein n=2 Tax=Azotobacter vinelandii TaxID=354 RepID=C1DMK2_AZOVD|nr:hypothetical protein Avin_52040 [Azotobacter vinelandii DJ]AGK15746.1 hypothetical protein AvCA_52040 [Azotobacter vinelandii CA]AGK22450.1 hypothetical protein AvCA6_52040 [Azotobacter vinelandii CA6]SFX28611.1 hypothetical protein SAMN04244547_01019 [Azotobacter vinelandii]